MQAAIFDMANRTDCWPWYWLSWGEKGYGFAVVEAFPVKDEDPAPEPGSQLKMDEGKWMGHNGVEMIIESTISELEQQNGDTICRFIAKAHGHLMGSHLWAAPSAPSEQEKPQGANQGAVNG